MEYSDLEDSYEWETEFLEWLRVNRKPQEIMTSMGDIPDIKREYSENFILQNILNENNLL